LGVLSFLPEDKAIRMTEYSGLLTDLYELTMAAGYLQTRFQGQATFELFVRHLPKHRNYLVAAGLEQALEFLENVRFSSDEIAFLRQHLLFSNIQSEFFDYLANFRFTGDVWAMPEGTLAFAGEPMLRVTAPIIEGQILETYLLATLSYQTMVASKAARVATAAEGRQVVDFGARRAHGVEASVLSARASVIGGCLGTSNTLAGHRLGMGVYGTQAHSWIMAHENEADAFSHFMDVFPQGAVLLVDTYDVRSAVKKIIAMGRKPAGIRLDSGDLAKDSVWVRRQLNRAGWNDVRIFASGDLDEYRIAALLHKGAAIDAFGVGSALATPSDAPQLSMIYKLVEVERGGKTREAAKLTHAKATYPGRKQVFRYLTAKGEFKSDRIAFESEPANGGAPLLIPMMRAGKRIAPAESISVLRDRCADGLAHLPPRVRQIQREAKYPVHFSKALEGSLEKVRQRIRRFAVK
jgi:nicotinate phosphoribosyltransferase